MPRASQLLSPSSLLHTNQWEHVNSDFDVLSHVWKHTHAHTYFYIHFYMYTLPKVKTELFYVYYDCEVFIKGGTVFNLSTSIIL